uniref:Uncharacterized protein n=1 Tax=Arundo donax TaxID=35708 RepID=A0A0A8Y4R3_ARUDO
MIMRPGYTSKEHESAISKCLDFF